MTTYDDFTKLDIRIGKIVDVQDFPEARKPAYILQIDFGDELGVKKSSAQLPQNYSKEDIIGKQILAVVNFPPRQIGPIRSEVLTLGLPDENGACILVTPDRDVPLGGRLF
ncbi:MAG TPA: tRNA-binding protein [Candidatus Saccharimonadales bacterium]|jgi:tRNA-binding protein|nr:tRNA-binding protein [Candidatus Saccharimonadales bacterium]